MADAESVEDEDPRDVEAVTVDPGAAVTLDKGHQVWSLTQFYSVGTLQSRISVKKSGVKIKVCFQRCPGTSAHSAAHLAVYLHL